MKNIELLHGDCLDLMANIPGNSVDMILTDLPFQQTSRNSWDVQIPLNDYVDVKVNKKQRRLYLNDFLLHCYENDICCIRQAREMFMNDSKVGLWSHYNRIIKDNGVIILFANGMFTADLMKSNSKMWKYNLIWMKTQPTGFLNAKKMPLRNHEDMCVFYKKSPTYNPQMTDGHLRKVSKAVHHVDAKETLDYGSYNFVDYDSTKRYPKSVWEFSKDTQKSALTPTQKPLALIEELIKTYTNVGDLVLDSCMGSNTTGLACKNLNRHYIGIEKDDDMFEIAESRIKK